MLKESAVASLGPSGLLLPSWVRSALAANDRLKLCFTALQTARAHAEAPAGPAPDFSRERAAAGLTETWIDTLAADARLSGDALAAPGLDRLRQALIDDLRTMAKPLIESPSGRAVADDDWPARLDNVTGWLGHWPTDRLPLAHISALASADRHAGDSAHLLVMDMHKALNRLAASIATEDIAGAHGWNLTDDADRARVRAFMRGVARTAPLKFDHPGLDTAATRDGARLVIQNDIGTNDAHVIVIAVEGARISVTYSDLHAVRFDFFRRRLERIGAKWTTQQATVTPGLNAGEGYVLGTATIDCSASADDGTIAADIDRALEAIGASLVFLIDWNRARKQLRRLVDKPVAVQVLDLAAEHGHGHMAFLRAGGDRLVFDAMQAVEGGVFRLGDTLDGVLGEEAARDFLAEALGLASTALRAGKPISLVEDEVKVLLAHRVVELASGFDLAAEHAAWCHELAQGVRDCIGYGADPLATAERARGWERAADECVAAARGGSERQPRRAVVARILVQADDVADALEEAAFTLGLAAERPGANGTGWMPPPVRAALLALAEATVGAVQDWVRAIAIARDLHSGRDDANAFLDATWRVLLAERRCDELWRDARRALLAHLTDPAALMLAADLASQLEDATDRLLAASYALRDLVLAEAGAQPGATR